MNSLGLLGDLCREVEWIWRRMQCTARSIQQCQDQRLEERLVVEMSIYRYRCLSIKAALTQINYSIEAHSIQKVLLEDLLQRCFCVAQMSCWRR